MTKARFFKSAILLSVAAFFGAGCSITGRERAARTSSSMEQMKSEIQKLDDLLEAAVEKLNDMVENPKPDLKPQYEEYTKAVTDLDAQLALVRARAEEMRQKGLAYFDTWKEKMQEVKNPELKQHALDREQKLRAEFTAIKDEVENLRKKSGPLITALRDVQTLLSLDLTPKGVESVADAAKKAREQLAAVREDARKVLEGLKRVATLISPAPAQ